MNRHNEQRLIEVQARQAAEVLNSTILGIRDPLATSLAVARLSSTVPAEFTDFMGACVGPEEKLFASVVLWHQVAGTYAPVVTIGHPVLRRRRPRPGHW